ncbi:MAG TPA: hypothetical protein VNR64_21640 [Vicinamibacterales bacterium]|nr:hypothetical protein [Vicinamibacterales bacterium]
MPKPTDEQDELFPMQEQTRPAESPLTRPEEELLRFEANPNKMIEPPEPPTGLRGWCWRLLGFAQREADVFEQLQRFQTLFIALYQLTTNTRAETHGFAQFLTSTNQVIGDEVIPQLNRQTNAISSLLDRLQFYERNVTLVGRARKSYDKLLAGLVAKREREAEEKRIREAADAAGITVADQPDPNQLPILDEASDLPPKVLTDIMEGGPIDGPGTLPTADEATDGDDPA